MQLPDYLGVPPKLRPWAGLALGLGLITLLVWGALGCPGLG